LIGKMIIALTPYYNKVLNRMSYKGRPALIIANADDGDYVALPISTIKNERRRDKVYDIEIKPEDYPNLHLRETSYIRTHKQSIINISNISKKNELIDLKSLYKDLYIQVLRKREEFSQYINSQEL